MGVQVRAPVIDKKLVNLFHMRRAMTHEAATIRVLVRFLNIYLFFDFGHEPNRYDSSTRLAGWITKGYEKTKFKLNAILMIHVIHDWGGKLSVISGLVKVLAPYEKMQSSENRTYIIAMIVQVITKMRK